MLNSMKQYKSQEVVELMDYMEQIRSTFKSQQDVQGAFMRILKDFKEKNKDIPKLVSRVNCLFKGHPEMIERFRVFLPTGYHIAAQLDGSVKLSTPSSTVAGVSQGPRYMVIPPYTHETLPKTIERSGRVTKVASTELEPSAVPQAECSRTVQQSGNSSLSTHSDSTKSSGGLQLSGNDPIQTSDSRTFTCNVPPIRCRLLKVEDAHKFLNRLKCVFVHQPEVFNAFLDVMKYYQEHKMDVAQVIEQAHCLFRGHLDVIEEFYGFLPPEYQMAMHEKRLTEIISPTASTESNSLTPHLTRPLQHLDSTEPINSHWQPMTLTPPPSPIQQSVDSAELANLVQ